MGYLIQQREFLYQVLRQKFKDFPLKDQYHFFDYCRSKTFKELRKEQSYEPNTTVASRQT